jgi:hypothetical protein
MKLKMLVFAAISFSLTGASRAADYSDLVAQGYRWVTVDGPYACPTEQDVQRITGHRTDAIELQMVGNLQAYYLVPGTIVQLVQDDPATGMSQIRMGGITTALWTDKRFLGQRPIEDPYGVIETPANSGLIPTETTGISELPDQSGTQPTWSADSTPSASPIPRTKSKK